MTKPGPDFVDQLHEAAAAAREILGELRSELREVRRERKALEDERAAAEAMVRRAVHDEIVAALKAEMDDLGPKLKSLSDDLYARISRESQKLLNLAMYGNEQGRGPSVLDEIRERLVRERDRLDNR